MVSKIFLQKLPIPRFELELRSQVESYVKAHSYVLIELSLLQVVLLCGLSKTDIGYRIAFHIKSFLTGFLTSVKGGIVDYDYQVDTEFDYFVKVHKSQIKLCVALLIAGMESKKSPVCFEFILRKICLEKKLKFPKEHFELFVDYYPPIVVEYLIAMRADFTPIFELGDKNTFLKDKRFEERKYMFSPTLYSKKRKEELFGLLEEQKIVTEPFEFFKRVQLQHQFIFTNYQEAFRYGANTNFINVNRYKGKPFGSLVGSVLGEDFADLFFLFYEQREKVLNPMIRLFQTFDDLYRFCRETKSEKMLFRMDLVRKYQAELRVIVTRYHKGEKPRSFSLHTERVLSLTGTYFGIKVGFEQNFLIQSKVLNEFYRSTKKGHPF